METTSTKPYFIRAIYEWCTDNGFTPYLAVKVDKGVEVPLEHVHNGEIVLNIRFDATSGLDIGNDYVRFQARFSGVVRDIIVPVDYVMAIYAKENGQGMGFPVTISNAQQAVSDTDMAQSSESGPGLHLVNSNEENQPDEEDVENEEIEDEKSEDDNPEDDDPDPSEPTPPENDRKSKKPTLRIVK